MKKNILQSSIILELKNHLNVITVLFLYILAFLQFE